MVERPKWQVGDDEVVVTWRWRDRDLMLVILVCGLFGAAMILSVILGWQSASPSTADQFIYDSFPVVGPFLLVVGVLMWFGKTKIVVDPRGWQRRWEIGRVVHSRQVTWSELAKVGALHHAVSPELSTTVKGERRQRKSEVRIMTRGYEALRVVPISLTASEAEELAEGLREVLSLGETHGHNVVPPQGWEICEDEGCLVVTESWRRSRGRWPGIFVAAWIGGLLLFAPQVARWDDVMNLVMALLIGSPLAYWGAARWWNRTRLRIGEGRLELRVGPVPPIWTRLHQEGLWLWLDQGIDEVSEARLEEAMRSDTRWFTPLLVMKDGSRRAMRSASHDPIPAELLVQVVNDRLRERGKDG